MRKKWLLSVGVAALAVSLGACTEVDDLLTPEGFWELAPEAPDSPFLGGAPVIVINPTAAGVEGVPWDLTGTITGATNAALTITADYGVGDGEVEVTLQGRSFALGYTYPDDGTYIVRVAVEDEHERAGTATIEVKVVTRDLVVADLELQTPSGEPLTAAAEGDAVVLVGAVRNQGQDAVSIEANFGDGTAAEKVDLASDGMIRVPHTFADDGNYDIRVTATDTDGDTGAEELRVTVTDVAPELSGEAAVQVTEGPDNVDVSFAIIDPGADSFTAQLIFTDDAGTPRPGTPAMPLTVTGRSVPLSLSYPTGPQVVHADIVVSDADPDSDATARLPIVITVANDAPALDTVSDQARDEGAELLLTLPFSDRGADTWTATVDWDTSDAVDPVAVAAGDIDPSARTISVRHTYDDEGSYPVAVSVSDGDDTGLATFTVNVANVAPIAGLGALSAADEGTPWQHLGQVVDPGADTLTATVSYAIAGATPVVEPLTLDDEGRYTLARTFANDGDVTVSVSVDDGDGGADTEDQALTVRNVLPHTLVCDPAALVAAEGQAVTATCTFSDSGADTWTGSVDFGDETSEALTIDSARSFTFTHAWAVEDDYPVVFTLNDGADTNATLMVTATIGNAPPIVVLDDTSPTGDEGSSVTITGQVFDATLSDAFTAKVDYGDGGGFTPFVVTDDRDFTLTHTYADDGSYPLQIEVTDADAMTGTLPEGTVVVIANVTPIIDTGLTGGAAVMITEGDTLAHTVTVTDAGGDSLAATVDYGLGEGDEIVAIDSVGRIMLSAVYPSDGAIDVIVKVTDEDDATTQATVPVAVANGPPVVAAGDALTVQEGTAFTRIISVTDPGGDAVTGTVDYGDGAAPAAFDIVEGAATLTHTYVDNGVYTVTATVSDDLGAAGSATIVVTVTNGAPTIDKGTIVGTDEGSPWNHTLTIGDPGANDSFKACVRWTASDIGCEEIQVAGVGPLALSHTWDLRGTYQVTVEIDDEQGGVTDETFLVPIANVAPVITAPATLTATEGTEWVHQITFTDPGNEMNWIVGIQYGDGATDAKTPNDHDFRLRHTYIDEGDDGEYVVAISVADQGGGSDSAEITVTVENVAPTVTLPVGPIELGQGNALEEAITITDPGTEDTHDLTIDFGDGTAISMVSLTGLSHTLNHTYTNVGTFTLSVAADDGDGGVGSDTVQVIVTNTTPELSLPSPVPAAHENVAWTANASFTDPDNEGHTARVDYGDGGGFQTLVVQDGKQLGLQHTFLQDGTYTVTVEVQDAANNVHSEGFQVVVANTPAVGAFGDGDDPPSYSRNEGQPLVIAGVVTDVGPLDVHTGALDYGDGGDPVAVTVDQGADTWTAPSHTWVDEGDYTMTLTLNDGADDTVVTAPVSVSNVAPLVGRIQNNGSFQVGTLGNLGGFQIFREKAIDVAITDVGIQDTHTATIDWGDGTVETDVALVTGQNNTPSHAYQSTGTFTVSVTVTDDDGASTGPITGNITVSIASPRTMLSFSETEPVLVTTVPEGTLVEVFGTYDDPDSTVHRAEVRWSNQFPTGNSWYCAQNSAALIKPPNNGGGVCATDPTPDGVLLIDNDNDTLYASQIYRRDGLCNHLRIVVGDESNKLSVMQSPNNCDNPTDPTKGTLKVNVTNVSPLIDLPPDAAYAVLAADRVFMLDVVLDDPGDETFTGQIDWGDGNVEAIASAISGTPGDWTLALDHAYAAEGVYAVQLTVDDGDDMDIADLDVHVAYGVCGQASAGDFFFTGIDPVDPLDYHKPLNWWPVGVPGPTDAISACEAGRKEPHNTAIQREIFVYDDVTVGSVHASSYVEFNARDQLTFTVTTGDFKFGGTNTRFKRHGSEADAATLVLAGTGQYHMDLNFLKVHVTGDYEFVGSESIVSNALDITQGKLRLSGDLRAYRTVSAISEDGSTGLRMMNAGSQFRMMSTFTATANPGAVTATSAGHYDVGRFRTHHKHITYQFSQIQPPGLTGETFVAGPDFVFEVDNGKFSDEFLALPFEVTFDSPGFGPNESHFGTLELFDTMFMKTDAAAHGIFWYRAPVTVTSEGANRTLTIGDGSMNNGRGNSGDLLDLSDIGLRVVGHTLFASELVTTGPLVVTPDGALEVKNGRLDAGSVTLTADDRARLCGTFDMAGVLQNSDCPIRFNHGLSRLGAAADMTLTGPGATTVIGLLDRGQFRVGGDLTISDANLDLSEAHEIALAGDGTPQRVTFSDVGDDIPANLALMGNARLELLNPMTLEGQLRKLAGGAATVAGAHPLMVGGVDVVGVIFDQTTLDLDGNVTQMRDVTFRNTDAAATAFAIHSAGVNQTASRLTFETVPTLGVGYYVDASTLDVADLTITDSAPGYGIPHARSTLNFTVNWGTADDDGDRDGVSDGDEWAVGLNPGLLDTDGDGIGDGAELALGADALDDTDAPLMFMPPESYSIPGTTPTDLLIAELDGEAGLDIAVTESSSGSAYIFPQDAVMSAGAGTFQAPETLAVGPLPLSVVAHGGSLYIGRDDGSVSRWGPVGAWAEISTFDAQTPVSVMAAWSVASGDELLIRGPNGLLRVEPDLTATIANYQNIAAIDVYRIVIGSIGVGGEAGFVTATELNFFGAFAASGASMDRRLGYQPPIPLLTGGAAVGDFDASLDGRDDVATTQNDDGAELRIYTNPASGNLTLHTTDTFRYDVTELAAGDLDGNGRVDIVGVVPALDALIIWLQAAPDADGLVFLPSVLPAPSGAGVTAVFIEDVETDGDLEIITLHGGDATFGVWRRIP